jgi:hypothetical protein
MIFCLIGRDLDVWKLKSSVTTLLSLELEEMEMSAFFT